ncbi:MAG: DegV family protein, partial [Peptococcaceae bacterium]|nr:DegV family protein [Peptococcaceae bacterium]
MPKVALVTDSTVDLADELRAKCDIHLIPLRVRLGQREYLDGEISGQEFYRQLQLAEGDIIQTSQPTPLEFKQLYQKLFASYTEIVSVHLSAALSGTVNAAKLAAADFAQRVHVIDSKTISLGMGLLVVEIAQRIQAGASASEILAQLTGIRQNVETLFTVNTLLYLQRGGRIGKVSGTLGSLLNVKPVIRVGEDG